MKTLPKVALAGLSGLCVMLANPAFAQKAKDLAEFPPYEAAYEPITVDEKGLWQTFDEFERRVSTSKDIIRDTALNNYVKDVLCSSVGADRCGAARIYIVRESSFNASMAPNGMMLINSGLLLRMRNEAELAAVLGHEFGHFESRHSLKMFEKIRSGTDWAAILGPIGAFFLLDIFSFSRDMEEEADLLSTEYLAASPYPSQAAADIWVRMIDEDEARRVERNRKSRNNRGAWFDSHPAPRERSEYLARAAADYADAGDFGFDRFNAQLEPYLLTFYEDQLQRNDHAASKFILEKIAGEEWQPIHYIMEGDLHRKRGNPRDLVTAEGAYREAIALGTKQPAAWRGLGLTLLRARKREEAADVLTTYLDMEPDAPDTAMVRMMIGGS